MHMYKTICYIKPIRHKIVIVTNMGICPVTAPGLAGFTINGENLVFH